MKKTFGEKLRTLRGTMSKLEFCKKLGIPYSSYTRFENQNRTPDWESIIKICEIMGVSADWFLGLSDHQITLTTSSTEFPVRGAIAAEPRGPSYRVSCPECAAKEDRIIKLEETIHNLSLGRSMIPQISQKSLSKATTY